MNNAPITIQFKRLFTIVYIMCAVCFKKYEKSNAKKCEILACRQCVVDIKTESHFDVPIFLPLKFGRNI